MLKIILNIVILKVDNSENSFKFVILFDDNLYLSIFLTVNSQHMSTTPNIYLSSNPFNIHLSTADYTIEVGELTSQLDDALLRTPGWASPHLQFKSFKGNTLTLINSFQEEQYLLRIVIQPTSLTVSCSCNQPVQTLCVHSYKALREIAFYKGRSYFKCFQPGGLAVTALANKHAFAFNHEQLGPAIVPVAPHQKLYGLGHTLSVTGSLLQQPNLEHSKNGLQVTYVILSFSKKIVPPILMPCLAKTAKAGNPILSFRSFPETIAPAAAHHFNETQLLLNKICLAMLKEAERLTAIDDWHGPSGKWPHYQTMFQLWQQCWPLLCTQLHVCYTHIYWLKFIKKKPRLHDTISITVSPEKIQPMFTLRKFPDHHRLSMSITQPNKKLQSNTDVIPFFAVCWHSHSFYLLPTLAMARLVSEMNNDAPFLSIFKQQYKAFQKNVIAPLQKQGLLTIEEKTKFKKQNTKIKRQKTKGTRNNAQVSSAS